MEKITKKSFIDLLCSHKSGFINSCFRKNDEWILNGISRLNSDAVRRMEGRTVTKTNSNSIMFSNDSYLYFNDAGKNEYFTHECNNIKYIFRKNTDFDNFDNCTTENYIIYALL